jgi:hypothetical protein
LDKFRLVDDVALGVWAEKSGRIVIWSMSKERGFPLLSLRTRLVV